MYFARVIRLDESDARIYATPSRPGEWAVPGAFAFLGVDIDRADGKTREAFRRGFLGTESFGWSTLVRVDEIHMFEYLAAIERLAAHFVERYGAPNLDAARAMAQEEAEFAASICNHPLNTLLALERSIGDEGIVENFRVARAPDGLDHERVKIWTVTDE
ncbi:MAG TPA: DUF6505 family protein [Candidatus Elarobacter sp.]